MRLLPRNELVKTSEIDQGDWAHRPLLKIISRSRFEIICKLLQKRNKYDRILEVGYGSGIFMPELAARAHEVYGIDVHPMQDQVASILKKRGINAKLVCGSVEQMPFPDDFFDCVVAVSAMEFVPNLEVAIAEIKRVLKPDGKLVLVTPGSSRLLDFGLRLMTGRSAKKDFGDGRERLRETLRRRMKTERQVKRPRLVSSFMCLYDGLHLSIPEEERLGREGAAGQVA